MKYDAKDMRKLIEAVEAEEQSSPITINPNALAAAEKYGKQSLPKGVTNPQAGYYIDQDPNREPDMTRRPVRGAESTAYMWLDVNGLLHRDGDLPARVEDNGTKHWYKHGKQHRDGGLPAVIWSDGKQYKSGMIDEFWVDGVQMNKYRGPGRNRQQQKTGMPYEPIQKDK